MTLFDWLYKYREKLEIEIYLAHVNHGVRRIWFEEEELKIAKKLGVSIFTSSFSGPFSEQKHVTFGILFQKLYWKLHSFGDSTSCWWPSRTIFMRILRGSRLFHIQEWKKNKICKWRIDKTVAFFSKSNFLLFFILRIGQSKRTICAIESWNEYFPLLEQENPQFRNINRIGNRNFSNARCISIFN